MKILCFNLTKCFYENQYQYVTCVSCIVKDELIYAIFRNSLHFKRKTVLQMFFFNLVEGRSSLFTSKQDIEKF